MKKTILTFAVLIGALSVMLTSCKKEKTDTGLSEAIYSLIMDGETIASGTTLEVGLMGNFVTVAEEGGFSILVSSVPVETGGVYQFNDSNSSGIITIMGNNLLLTDGSDELYFSISGTITRVSTTKISFNGICSAMLSTETHTFSGTLESDAFKLIYVID